jgi:hypothetical protein
MWLLAVEAIVALSLFVLIVWWTMFAGKPKQHRKSNPPKTNSTTTKTEAQIQIKTQTQTAAEQEK